MRRRLATLALLLLVGCSQPPTTSAVVELSEFDISLDSARWQAGPVRLRVVNQGDFPHTLVVTSSDGTVLAAARVLQFGEEVEMELDLPPGDYGLSCRVVVKTDDGTLIDHFELGMHAHVRVVEG